MIKENNTYGIHQPYCKLRCGYTYNSSTEGAPTILRGSLIVNSTDLNVQFDTQHIPNNRLMNLKIQPDYTHVLLSKLPK